MHTCGSEQKCDQAGVRTRGCNYSANLTAEQPQESEENNTWQHGKHFAITNAVTVRTRSETCKCEQACVRARSAVERRSEVVEPCWHEAGRDWPSRGVGREGVFGGQALPSVGEQPALTGHHPVRPDEGGGGEAGEQASSEEAAHHADAQERRVRREKAQAKAADKHIRMQCNMSQQHANINTMSHINAHFTRKSMHISKRRQRLTCNIKHGNTI